MTSLRNGWSFCQLQWCQNGNGVRKRKLTNSHGYSEIFFSIIQNIQRLFKPDWVLYPTRTTAFCNAQSTVKRTVPDKIANMCICQPDILRAFVCSRRITDHIYLHSLRLRPHVSGYFLIRNFFFPDTKISASTRYVNIAYLYRIRPSTRIRIHSGFTEDWQDCPTRH